MISEPKEPNYCPYFPETSAKPETIFERATGFELLPADEANEKVIDLYCRNAALELGLKMATKFCHLKQSGFCYASCAAMPFCEGCGGLRALSFGELPSSIRGVLT